ncbi:MAG: hypothetical protein KGL99_16580 [Burkholderiales bacterium]|nr:hypothetical protein [Burkholderiales bacterium]
MRVPTRIVAALLSAGLVCIAIPAHAQRHWGGGHGGHGDYGDRGHFHRGGGGWGWGPAWGLGIGLGLGLTAAYWDNYWGPYNNGYVVVQSPPPVTVVQQPAVVQAAPSVAPSSAPAPVIYPRNGQSPAQTESDRQDCNRWSTTVPGALADSSVMMRAIAACMDARGYTLR